jgi:hypothetical protein
METITEVNCRGSLGQPPRFLLFLSGRRRACWLHRKKLRSKERGKRKEGKPRRKRRKERRRVK